MRVNFDGLRKNGANAYNRLVRELNRHVHGEEMGPGRNHGDQFCTGDIRDSLDDLRACLGTLLALEDDGDMKALEIDLLEFDSEGA